MTTQFKDLITIQNAITNFMDTNSYSGLSSAVEKTKAHILNEICDGIRWEDGEDTIDSDAFRYGVEIAANYSFHMTCELRQILGG